MFSFLQKDPKKKLKKEYELILGKAMAAQRSGDIRLYSELSEQAEKIRAEMDSIDG